MPARSPQHLALGLAVRERRQQLKLSQEELGRRCGLNRTYVGAVERGERNLSFSNLVRLAEAVETSPSRLLWVAEDRRI